MATNQAQQQFPPLESTTCPTPSKAPATHVASLHPKARTPISTKVKCQQLNQKKENKLAAQHAADMKAARELRKTCADKAFIMDGARLLLLAVVIGAQGVVKATTDVELWNDPVLIAITSGVMVKAPSALLRVIQSLFPLSRSAGQQDEKKKTASKKK